MGLLLVVLIVLPLGAVVVQGFAPRYDPAPHPELQLFAWLGTISGLLAASCGLAASVTAAALLIGLPLGIVLGRFDVPGARAALLFHGFPMFLPPFLLALGWFHLLGREGLVGSEATARAFFNWPGAILVLTLSLAPFVTWLVVLGVRGVDPALEEAARLVASPARLATRILLPLATPAAGFGALIVFALAFSELGVPIFLGIRAYPAAIFARLGGIDYAPTEAAALSVPMVAISLGLLTLERWLVVHRAAPTLSWRASPGRLPLGRWRFLVGVIVWGAVVVSLLPLAALAGRARDALSDIPSWIGSSLESSLISSSAAATLIAALGLVAGPMIGRRRPGARILDGISFVGFVTPAALLGVGLMSLWNRPITGALYGSLAILVIGYAARYAVVGVRSVAVGVSQTSPATEEAAATVGAGFLRRLLFIVAREQRGPLLTAWILGFVFSLRDLDMAVLFYPAGREPLIVRIFTLEANGPEAIVASLAMVQVAVTAGALVLGAGLLRLGGRAR